MEFDLIARIRSRADASRADVVLGIGDDAALLAPAPGQHLVVAMDTLNAGVHFPPETAPAELNEGLGGMGVASVSDVMTAVRAVAFAVVDTLTRDREEVGL